MLFRSKIEKSQIENYYQRLIWIKNLENNSVFQISLLPRECRPLYSEAKKCFLYGMYRGSIVIMETALTALLFKSTKLEYIRDKWPRDAIMKKNNRTKKDTMIQINKIENLTFNKLINLTEEKEIITADLAKELHIFRWIRHGVAHHGLVQKSHLGLKWTSVRGEGMQVYGYGFESPFKGKKTQIVIDKNGNHKEERVRVPIKLHSLFEGAQKGFEEFFNLFKCLQ